jgi:RNA polymerase sigma factor (sigma-70 family)
LELACLILSVNHTTGINPADKHLVDRVLRGDTRAFGIILKNTENLVAQIIFKLIPIAEDRKDLAQEIYMKAFHNLPGFKFQSKLSTWIAQIAYNSCLSWLEKKKLVLTGNLDEDEEMYETTDAIVYNNIAVGSYSENRLFQKELSGILRKEIEVLPPIYKTLITLFHHESMSYTELSQITGMPEGTVKSSLFRARKMLKENLLSKYQKEAL